MKKVFLLISSLVLLSITNSCSESELDLVDPNSDAIENIDSEDKLQKFLNGAYLNVASVNGLGTQVTAMGDVISDHLYVTSSKAYAITSNLNYNAVSNDFSFYGTMYNAIMNCNMVINNTAVPNNASVARIKAEAKIMRAFAYFTLVNYYSPTPSSGINQEYGVPLVLTNYDSSIQPARATVGEVYSQIISDLNDGIKDASDKTEKKVILTKTAAKLILSRVYLTRRAAGDAQLALQYATEVVNLQNESGSVYAPIVAKGVPGAANTANNYELYFSGSPEASSEAQKETIWELDFNNVTNNVTGVGANLALPTLYSRLDSRRALLFSKEFIDSFPHTNLPTLANGTPQSYSPDVRRGSTKTSVTSATTYPGVPTAVQAAGLLTTINLPTTENVPGAWTNKYPRTTEEGNFLRNIKVFRFAEAQLNRIEALFLTGQTAVALSELNAFAISRGGSTYSAATIENILAEKNKEFYGEGQRFLDLKRWSLPLIKNSNCTINCNVPANDKLFTLPISQDAINNNVNLKQYPGY